MISLTENNFQKEVLESNMPVMVDFSATWCGPCQVVSPVLEELAKTYEGKLKVGKLDVDQNNTLAQKFGILSVPTIIFFKNGQEVKREVGFPGKEVYERLIKEVISLS